MRGKEANALVVYTPVGARVDDEKDIISCSEHVVSAQTAKQAYRLA